MTDSIRIAPIELLNYLSVTFYVKDPRKSVISNVTIPNNFIHNDKDTCRSTDYLIHFDIQSFMAFSCFE